MKALTYILEDVSLDLSLLCPCWWRLKSA